MLDATKLLANALGEHLALIYRRTFGSREPGTIAVIEESARLTVERIAQSDALYHDADHTTLVTLVAQDILRGRFSASCALSARSPHPAGNSPRRNNRPTAL